MQKQEYSTFIILFFLIISFRIFTFSVLTLKEIQKRDKIFYETTIEFYHDNEKKNASFLFTFPTASVKHV